MLGIYKITNDDTGDYYIDDNMIPEENANHTVEILETWEDQESLDLAKDWYDKYIYLVDGGSKKYEDKTIHKGI